MAKPTAQTTTLSASTVYSGKSTRKYMIIEMEGSVPTFKFEGPWVGRDIATVERNIRRQYFQRQRLLKRNEEASQQEAGKQEEKPAVQ